MLNRIILMGRLTRDPELRHTQTGTAVASFSLAVDRDFKDRTTGEKATDFIDIVAWRQTAEFVSRFFTKGRMAVVEGRLQLRDWTDRDGNKRRSAEVVADNVYFGDSKRDAEGGGYGAPSGGYGAPGGYAPPAAPVGGGYAPPAAPAGGDQFAELTEDDGELPF
nr:single-stranded DNA-binding protein [uncultured Flavonifractor sp.]